MNLYLRLLALLLLGRRRSRASPLGPVRTPFRVWPTDLDLLLHMNNGKYLTIMDAARIDLLVRAGVIGPLRARGWYPVIVAETITFHRSLTLFQRFEIRTEVIGWDDKSVFLSQVFHRGGNRIATAVVRVRFLGRGGQRVTPVQVLSLAGAEVPRPELPAWVAKWAAAAERAGPTAGSPAG